ncbi:TPA: DUF542 domain-containing protein [Candidatus Gracilibacteria bacterium]|nr:DUF542 domain-containing protein [Candidatus Gracilibacteria bacterium]
MNLLEQLVGDIVKKNPETASIFSKNGIEFCCRGAVSLKDAISEAKIDEKQFITSLKKIKNNTETLEENFDELTRLAIKVANVHGNRREELLEIRDVTLAVISDLKEYFSDSDNTLPSEKTKNLNAVLKKLQTLTNDYNLPAGACMSYTVLYNFLEKLDLGIQKYIESFTEISIFTTSKFLENIEYNDKKPVIKMMLESHFTKEIRIVFKAGQIMKKHQTPFPIVVELIEGVLDFGIYNKEGGIDILHFEKGDMISVSAGIPHDLTAISNCIARLTLSTGDTKKRVDEVETM